MNYLCTFCGREWDILALALDEHRNRRYVCIECKPTAFNLPGSRHVTPRLVGGVS